MGSTRAQYVNESMSKFIPDKDLFENVLLESPVPTTETAKSRLKSQEIRKVLKEEKERTFRSGPPSKNNKQNGGGQFSSRNQSSGKRRETFLQQCPRYSLGGEFCQGHPVVKKMHFFALPEIK